MAPRRTPGATGRGRVPEARRLAVRVGILVALVNLLSPNSMVSDSVRVVPVAQALLTRGTLALKDPPSTTGTYAITARGSTALPLFPWTISLFVLPVVAATDLVHVVGAGGGASIYGDGSPEDWPLEMLSMSVVVGWTAGLVCLIGMELASDDDERLRRRVGAGTALVFAFGTSAWSTAGRAAWQHGPSMLLLAAALLVAVRSRRRPFAAGWFGAFLAAAFTVRPTNAAPLVVLGVWAVAAHRGRASRAVAPALAVLVPFAAVNLVAYHAVLPPYYLGNSFHGHPDVLGAVAGNLVSPARGLLVFSPVAVLAPVGVWFRRRRGVLDGLDVALATTVLLHLAVISTLDHWWGGFGYGPRLFTDMVPFLVVMAVPALEQLWTGPRSVTLASGAVALLVAWSVFANAEGALFRSTACWNVTPDVDNHPARVWSWSDAQVISGVRGVFDHGLVAEMSPGGYATSQLRACPGARP